MQALTVTRGRTVKTVLVVDIADTDTDEQVLNTAMVEARENRSSLFGWRVSRDVEDNTRAVVSLYTD